MRRTKQLIVGERRMRAALDRYRKGTADQKKAHAGLAADIELRLGDRAAEHQLASQFPHDLHFDPDRPAVRKASTERFQRWVKGMQANLEEAHQRYTAAAVERPAQARTRAAYALDGIAGQLSHGHMPDDIRKPPYETEKMDAYCDELARVAGPIENQAARWKPSKP